MNEGWGGQLLSVHRQLLLRGVFVFDSLIIYLGFPFLTRTRTKYFSFTMPLPSPGYLTVFDCRWVRLITTEQVWVFLRTAALPPSELGIALNSWRLRCSSKTQGRSWLTDWLEGDRQVEREMFCLSAPSLATSLITDSSDQTHRPERPIITFTLTVL